MVLNRLAKSSIVEFVTDTSKENSIKQHRRTSEILLISDPKTEAPKKLERFHGKCWKQTASYQIYV